MITNAEEVTARAVDQRPDPALWVRTNVLARSVPRHARGFWFCFGGLTFATALLQALSGIVLAFYYQPTPERAYASIFYISHFVNYGWFIRSVHVWGSRLMVVFIVIHMLRVYVSAAYKHPREWNWVAGVFLFIITMAFGLTGSLLPWDQKAYWGTTGAIAFIEKTPLVGERLSYFIVGGHTIGAAALSRFYSGHIMLLPAATAVLLFLHFRMVRKQGISGPL
jgi:quinol-cytochrome oxidoreductase complex cytochrome b subunit